VKRVETDRTRFVHIEEDIPETPPTEEVSTLATRFSTFTSRMKTCGWRTWFPISTSRADQVAKLKVATLRQGRSERLPPDAHRALTLRYIVGLHVKSSRSPSANRKRRLSNWSRIAARISRELVAFWMARSSSLISRVSSNLRNSSG